MSGIALEPGDDGLVLELLRGLADSPAPSQRAVAELLGVSVGKTHYVLRALMDKGLVTLENVRSSHKRATYLYVLTPRGMAEKGRLTRRFLQRKMDEYERLKLEIERLARDAEARV